MTDLATGAAPAAPEPAAIANVQTAETSPMERIERTMSETYDKINPPRENGKFVAKDKPEEAPAVAAKPAAEITDQNPVEAEVKPPVQAAIDAPISWSAEMKAKFATLPPDAQTYIAQREGEAHKRISELGQQVKAFEPYRSVEERFSGLFQKNGLRAPEATARALAVAEMFEENPENAIHELAKAYGVDLYGSQPAQGEQQQESGEVRALKAEVAQLKRAIGETASKVTARERSEQEREQTALETTISKFAEGKPHFEKVRTHMAGLMQSGAAQTLEEAYDMATYALPEIRKSLLEDQRKAEQEKQDKEREEKAKEAKRLGSINVKSNGASPARKGTWEETLRAVGDKIA